MGVVGRRALPSSVAGSPDVGRKARGVIGSAETSSGCADDSFRSVLIEGYAQLRGRELCDDAGELTLTA